MRLLSQALCLCLALALCLAAPPHHGIASDHQGQNSGDHHGQNSGDHHGQNSAGHHDSHHDVAHLGRCQGIEFDAIAPDEKGTIYFFKGTHAWKGFEGPEHNVTEFFHELDDHHALDHIDAAFRLHRDPDTADHKHHDDHDHDHIFLFLGDKVYSYYNHALEAGFPKAIHDVFKGIPDHLDAAVECPKGECQGDSVLFFKDSHVYHFDLKTQIVKTRDWSHLTNCTSALRWLGRYYCFHGHQFTKFHPVTGEVTGDYPKDTRNYFMQCPGFGHGTNSSERDHLQRCSKTPFDALTVDDHGKSYIFRGAYFLRLDTKRDGWHAWPIDSQWKEVHSDVDAVFSWDHKLYIIKRDQVYIYKSDQHYVLVEGYPKSVEEELHVKGHVDAAFVCPGTHVVHIIQGSKMIDVDLTASPRAASKEWPLPYKHIDAAKCGPEGVRILVGAEYFDYGSPMLLATGRIKPIPHSIADMLGCHH
ncbi:hemopexin [Amia ocellicauda]|uniref:hemopexin n=1 Tax=Amia ocellicauda TaxID=2972642 RepID=UPI003463F4B0